MSPWLYAAGYAVFGGLLLGAVARWWQGGSPALWRPFMLSVGSLAAALEIWSYAQGGPAGVLVDRWMVALLGLLVGRAAGAPVAGARHPFVARAGAAPARPRRVTVT